ncbi:hypothetical protein LZ30DRAFT_720875 [Colletotrichum cereale]|nr:hypothetical protein LZ30DRAFT_720875 [Colletotrichum cereale]
MVSSSEKGSLSNPSEGLVAVYCRCLPQEVGYTVLRPKNLYFFPHPFRLSASRASLLIYGVCTRLDLGCHPSSLAGSSTGCLATYAFTMVCVFISVKEREGGTLCWPRWGYIQRAKLTYLGVCLPAICLYLIKLLSS